MSTKRNLDEVIDAMLGHIPESEVAFRKDLEKVKHDAGYHPPEMAYVDWGKAGYVLSRHLGDDMEAVRSVPWKLATAVEFNPDFAGVPQ